MGEVGKGGDADFAATHEPLAHGVGVFDSGVWEFPLRRAREDMAGPFEGIIELAVTFRASKHGLLLLVSDAVPAGRGAAETVAGLALWPLRRRESLPPAWEAHPIVVPRIPL